MRLLRTMTVAGMISLVGVMVGTSPAAANVGSSASLTVPVSVTVGDTGVAGSMTVVNINTPPNEGDPNTLTLVELAPSCAAIGTGATACPTPDTGNVSVSSPATGGAGTACAGVTFTVTLGSGGVYTFTPSSGVVLAPPGGAPGTDRCTINFTSSVSKVPATDVDTGAPGTQTFANARIQSRDTAAGITVSNAPHQEITVHQAVPSLTTHASASSVSPNQPFTDTATVGPVSGGPTPTGSVVFDLHAANDPTCDNAPIATSTTGLVGGTATSAPFSQASPGTYRFVATYSGDANYVGKASGCADAVNVVAAPAPTTVVAQPVIRLTGLLTLSARLTTSSGAPVAGRILTFVAGTTPVCTAATDATGTATCSNLSAFLRAALALGYNAVFAGDNTYAPSTGHGTLI
jgi:hypothetical protein